MIKSSHKKNAKVRAIQDELLKKKLKEELPHLYGFPPYKWTLEYWKSTNRMKLITAGNQLSKSTTQIRHCIDLATDKKKWPDFFPHRKPVTFWYIYPDWPTVDEEYELKWKKECLPRGSMKNSEVYGYEEIRKNSRVIGLKFTSGVTVMFKTWKSDLQSSTIDACFVDEELPVKLYDEVVNRLNRYAGMFSMVFTATLGQQMWYDTMEKRGKPNEKFPEAFKRQISMEHDCRYYADGTSSPWTPEEVARRKAKCGSDKEIDKRIHGRFVSPGGLKVPSFDSNRNIVKKQSTRLDWLYYGGVDVGMSGECHPAAITIVTVNPEFTYGRVIRTWRGKKTEVTTSEVILNKYIEMTNGLPMTMNLYDWAGREFYERTLTANIAFEAADKSKDGGYDLLNLLFKHKMLELEMDDGTDQLETDTLEEELNLLKDDTRKQNAKDDQIDSLRYAITRIPWDTSGIVHDIDLEALYRTDLRPKIKKKNTRHQPPTEEELQENDDYSFQSEIDEYNDLMEFG